MTGAAGVLALEETETAAAGELELETSTGAAGELEATTAEEVAGLVMVHGQSWFCQHVAVEVYARGKLTVMVRVVASDTV